MENTFKENKILLYLEEKNSLFYNKILEIYDIADNILKEIPKTFSNYTLHDIKHSIRVINYMTNFVETRLEQFSDLDLAMIVYVGLLHDVGMFVSDDERNQLIDKFENQSSLFKNLSERNKNEYLQKYVRERHGSRVKEVLREKYIETADIRSFFRVGQSYFFDDIIAKICQSHTEDCEWIVNNLEAEDSIGDYDINPQYIAFLLRLGDALDIDDRRAPWVLYNLLNPQGESSDEWKKHVPIRNYQKVREENGEYIISFSGRSEEPKIYRKVMEYINWLDEDLRKITIIVKKFSEPYKLKFKLPIVNKVKSVGFKTSDLKFNLNYEQIVTLLMGENIYGSKKDGLREILQNAIDASLLMDNIYKQRGRLDFKPCVRIELDKKKNQIVVFDNGTGMSSNILKKYFFNIGSSFYSSKEFIEGFYDYKPIGHFGIGFLACFMLSSTVTLETKYYESGEMQRINFEKNSPYVIFVGCESNEFPGEHGTRIMLKYNQIIGEVFESEDVLIEYVKELLITTDYDCQILRDGQIYSLKKPFQSDGCVVISNSDMDIAFKLKKNPDMVTDCCQLVTMSENAFYVKTNSYEDYEDYATVAFLYEQAEMLDSLRNDSTELFIESVKEYFGVYEWEYDVSDAKKEYSSKEYYDLSYYEKLFELFSETGIPLWEALDTDILETLQKKILNDSYREGCICWYDVPYIGNKDVLANFLAFEETHGYEQAMERYEHAIKYFSVFGRETLSDTLSFELCDSILELEEEGIIGDYSYFERELFKPIPRKQEVIKHVYDEAYLPITKKYNFKKNNVDYKVYMKGIWVHKSDITLPYIISGTAIEQVYINIKSDKYETNVARSELSNTSIEMLSKNIAVAIYNWRLENKIISDTEKDLITKFLKKYYQ